MSGGTYTGKGEKDGPMQIDDETLIARGQATFEFLIKSWREARQQA